MVMHGIRDGKGPLAVEEQVSEQIDQLEQALRHETGNKAHHRCVGGRFYHRGLNRDAEFSKPLRARWAFRRVFRLLRIKVGAHSSASCFLAFRDALKMVLGSRRPGWASSLYY